MAYIFPTGEVKRSTEVRTKIRTNEVPIDDYEQIRINEVLIENETTC